MTWEEMAELCQGGGRFKVVMRWKPIYRGSTRRITTFGGPRGKVVHVDEIKQIQIVEFPKHAVRNFMKRLEAGQYDSKIPDRDGCSEG